MRAFATMEDNTYSKVDEIDESGEHEEVHHYQVCDASCAREPSLNHIQYARQFMTNLTRVSNGRSLLASFML